MGTESSSLGVFLFFLSFLSGFVWGGKQVYALMQRRGRSMHARCAAWLCAGLVSAFGAAVLTGAMVMPTPDGGAVGVGALGAALLLPFAWLHWRNRKASSVARSSSADAQQHTGIPVPEPVRLVISPAPVPPVPAVLTVPPSPSVSSTPEAQPPAGRSPQEPAQLVMQPVPVPTAASVTPASAKQATTPPKQPPRASARRARAPTADITLPHRFRITYPDKTGDWSQRDVRVDRISSNESHTFLEGFCELRWQVRTFRTDRMRGDLLDLETGEVLPLRRLLAGVTDRSKPSFKPGGRSSSRSSSRASSE